jgi:pimeloyl-ACP methyl ester carboxylesterase
MTDLAADVRATQRVLDEFDTSVVLVGHSYGGAVITEAGARPHVAHLLYLAAFQLAEGESVGRTLPDLQIPPTRLGDAHRISDDGGVDLDPALAAELFYADTPPPVAAAAVARLRPVRRQMFADVPQEIAWRHRPSTYVVCTEDRALHPDLQRAMARRASFRHEWPTGHSPALSCPDRWPP